MSNHLVALAVIWLAYPGLVGTVAAADHRGRLVGPVATGGLFAALIASVLVVFA